MYVKDFSQFIAKVPEDVADVFRSADPEFRGVSLEGGQRLVDLRKIRDQLDGPPKATSDLYHPDQVGLNKEQQAYFREILKRSHVNLCEPALDRLVNSIHSGKIQRHVDPVFAELRGQLKSGEHAQAMTAFCEHAFAYGTGYLVPLVNDRGEVTYWVPDPLRTIMVVDPMEVTRVLGIAELVAYDTGINRGMRFVTERRRGQLIDGELSEEEHGLGFLPAVVAFGRDRRNEGKVYGKSLILGVADASIRITNNEVNLELLRDRQTQALLVVQGEPTRTSKDDQEAKGKYITFPKDGGDARYETPESRIEAVIELTKRFAEDAAIASGLPLDTFLPSLIAGADASATAARIRAFPLQQRMTRLVRDWETTERNAAAVLAGVLAVRDGEYGGESLRELAARVDARVAITPSLPEAEAETLAAWQQKVANFFVRAEDAIEHYSEHLPDEAKARLAEAWRLVNDPQVKNGAADEVSKFRRDIAKALYGGATTKEVMANLTNLRELVEEVGLPVEGDYEEPWLPIVAPVGPIVTGEELRDSAGDVVGGMVGEMPENSDARDAQEGASR